MIQDLQFEHRVALATLQLEVNFGDECKGIKGSGRVCVRFKAFGLRFSYSQGQVGKGTILNEEVAGSNSPLLVTFISIL